MRKKATGQIKTDYGIAKQFPIKKGLPQGDALSPVIYAIFLDPLITLPNDPRGHHSEHNIMKTRDMKKLHFVRKIPDEPEHLIIGALANAEYYFGRRLNRGADNQI